MVQAGAGRVSDGAGFGAMAALQLRCIRASDKGEMRGSESRPIGPEQMNFARLQPERPRVKMERGI